MDKKTLVIVESPSKAKTINKYLGEKYEVISSKGHIIDLPESELGIDINNNYTPNYVIIEGKQKVIEEIINKVQQSYKIILATDPDREGEAISWHIFNIIKPYNNNVERIVFYEVTKEAVLQAIKEPKSINIHLVNAQQARRILDRLVGYTLSPFLWRKIKPGLSAGRVQSVALRLIVDREEERRKFVKEEKWSIYVVPTLDDVKQPKIEVIYSNSEDDNSEDLEDDGLIQSSGLDKSRKQTIVFELKSINNNKFAIASKDEFDKLANLIRNGVLKITNVNKYSQKRNPSPPFTTSTFQQACVNLFGITAKGAMKVAQKLYENGFITYMRTDSVHLSQQAIKQIRNYVTKHFGADYLPEEPIQYKSKGVNTQEAHEGIRPTNFELRYLDKSFSEIEKKVYDLIYRRALSSQMKPAEYVGYKVIAKLDNNTEGKSFEFSANARQLVYEGWLKAWNVDKNDSDRSKLDLLLSFKEGQEFNIQEIIGRQSFTKPPSRYSEAKLIEALDSLGVGRPSTYATIINIITQREYVKKDGKYFYPTDIGETVIKLLKEHFSEIVDIGFTANMEEGLDKIALGEQEWVPFVDAFYKPYNDKLQRKIREVKKEDFTNLGVVDEVCSICGKNMVKRIGRFGVFLACSDYPRCQGTKKVIIQEKEYKINMDLYKLPPVTEDGRAYVLRKGRFGYFWAHPDYPKVKDVKALEVKEDQIEKFFGKPPQAKDGTLMVLKSNGLSKFYWTHKDYPNVKEIKNAEFINKNAN